MWYALDMNSSDTSIGAVVQASCPPGQVFRDSSLHGNVTATCLENGKWSPVLTDCKGKIKSSLLIALGQRVELQAVYKMLFTHILYVFSS
jgi:Hormone receptor domain/Sushi repeat (SCR repeat)